MKKLLSRISLFTIIVAYIVFIFNTNTSIKTISPSVLGSFFLIGFYAIQKILLDKNYYSLKKMHWYFIFIFMFVAPLCQYLSSYKPWGYTTSNSTLLIANIIVIVWILVFDFSYHMKKNFVIANIWSSKRNSNPSIAYVPTKDIDLYLYTLFAIVCFVVIGGMVGFTNLTSVKADNSLANSNWSILINLFLRSVPPIVLSILLLKARKSKRYFLSLIIICSVVNIFTNFPASLARYWILPIYFGVVLALVPPSKFKNSRFDVCVILGLCVVFPFMTLFKRMTYVQVISGAFNFDIANIYNNVDFDAHSILCRTIEFVSSNGIMLGRQLRSVVFFFVPRFILNIKGTPSGELVALSQNSAYVNISCPIMGEAYIDFGIIGVICYAFIIGRIFRKLDIEYWQQYTDSKQVNVSYLEVVYIFMQGFTIYLFRGSLQPTFLRVMGFFLFLICLRVINNILKR